MNHFRLLLLVTFFIYTICVVLLCYFLPVEPVRLIAVDFARRSTVPFGKPVFSPDGKRLVVIDFRCAGQLLEFPSGKVLVEFPPLANDEIGSIYAQFILAGSVIWEVRSDRIRLWSSKNGALLSERPKNVGGTVAVWRDRYLVYQPTAKTLTVWDVQTNEELRHVPFFEKAYWETDMRENRLTMRMFLWEPHNAWENLLMLGSGLVTGQSLYAASCLQPIKQDCNPLIVVSTWNPVTETYPITKVIAGHHSYRSRFTSKFVIDLVEHAGRVMIRDLTSARELQTLSLPKEVSDGTLSSPKFSGVPFRFPPSITVDEPFLLVRGAGVGRMGITDVWDMRTTPATHVTQLQQFSYWLLPQSGDHRYAVVWDGQIYLSIDVWSWLRIRNLRLLALQSGKEVPLQKTDELDATSPQFSADNNLVAISERLKKRPLLWLQWVREKISNWFPSLNVQEEDELLRSTVYGTQDGLVAGVVQGRTAVFSPSGKYLITCVSQGLLVWELPLRKPWGKILAYPLTLMLPMCFLLWCLFRRRQAAVD
jgi:hypothetical protein